MNTTLCQPTSFLWDEALPENDIRDRTESERIAREDAVLKRTKKKLASARTGRAVFDQLASDNPYVTDAETRMLRRLLNFGDPGLGNCFPSLATIRRRLGGPRRSPRRIANLLKSLEDKGWIKRVPLTEDDDGHWVPLSEEGGKARDEWTGRFIAAVGVQFCVPANTIVRGADAWEGPLRFEKRR